MAVAYHVLLAEDSPLNQDVGKAMLETLGCAVDVAANGAEALRMAAMTRYDLVFMDCQMPLMDGCEATVKIREDENGKGPRVPIIALTAHMMESDREKCLSAGMDDFLSKPFRLKELAEMLSRWTGRSETVVRVEPGATAACSKLPLEEQTAHRLSGSPDDCIEPGALENIRSLQKAGSPDMLKRVIQIYMTDSVLLIDEMIKALAEEDPEALRKAAHKLKSSSANLGAGRLAGFCRQVEEIGRAESTEGISALISLIRKEHRIVEEALSKEI